VFYYVVLRFLIFYVLNPTKTQVLTRSRTGSDYIIWIHTRKSSDYMIRTIPKCGLWCYKQGLDSMWCVNWILNIIHVFFNRSYNLKTFMAINSLDCPTFSFLIQIYFINITMDVVMISLSLLTTHTIPKIALSFCRGCTVVIRDLRIYYNMISGFY